MVDYDSALPMRGAITDGLAVDATTTGIPIVGTDGSNYQFLSTDSSGVLNTNATITWNNANKVVVTDGTDDLQIVVDGATAGTNGVHILGTDGTNAQILKTDTAGSLFVNTGGSPDDTVNYATANLVKDTATTTATIAGVVTVAKVIASGSGLMKVEVKYGTTASEAVIAVLFNSTANPNIEFEFPKGLLVASGETILLSCTNLENAASPASDFSGYGSIVTTA